MKIFYKCILFVLLISCRTNGNTAKDLDNYKKGMEALEIDVNLSEALNYFDRSVKENPEHMESKYWKMSCEFQIGKLDDALKTAKFVITDPKNKKHRLLPHFFVTAGLIERINSNTDQSVEYFKSANKIFEKRIRKDGDDIDAILNKTTVLCYMNKKDEAIKFLDSLERSKENQAMLEQIRVQIAEFDADKVMLELIESKN